LNYARDPHLNRRLWALRINYLRG